MCRKKTVSVIDENRKEYQKFFGIEGNEQYLIYYEKSDDGQTGYIVYIDNDFDLDYIDKRDKSTWTQEEVQEFHRAYGKLQKAEAAPCHNLRKRHLLSFKRFLGSAYLQILEKDFSGVDKIIQEADEYLRQRNVEMARELFLQSGLPVAAAAAVAGFAMYFMGYFNTWLYGILFGIFGAFFSIWIRYGKEEMTGLASKSLHYLESVSRLFIGAIAAVLVMFIARSGLLISIQVTNNNLIFLNCVLGFAAGFSERLVPSLLEKLISKQTK